MKIRSRLFLLVGITASSFVLLVCIYFALMSPIEKMEQERSFFTEYSKNGTELIANVNRLMVEPSYTTQLSKVTASKETYLKATQQIAKITLLQAISPVMAQAVTAVNNLKDLATSNLDDLDSSSKELLDDINSFYSTSADTVSIPDLQNENIPKSDDKAAKIVHDITVLKSSIVTFNDILFTSNKIIQEKEKIIIDEINKEKLRNTMIAGVLILLVLILVLLLSFRITKYISSAISSIEKSIKIMSDGDFTHQFEVKSKDELGVLAKNLNHLQSALTQSIGSIQQVSEKNLLVKSDLTKSVSEATASSTEIEANTDSILNQMKKMGNIMDQANQEVEQLVQAVANFDERLKTQNTHVEQSAAVITQMMASIKSVSVILQKNQQISQQLVASSEHGRELLSKTFEKVLQMSESAAAIEEMVGVITQVASQTNLLAMNAAIEAAHAGESGKGFSVVADEISKLAEATSSSTKEISHTIQEVLTSIHEANDTRDETLGAFMVVTDEVKLVATATEEVSSNMAEMETGSQQILSSMENLKTASEDLTQEFDRTKSVSISFQKVVQDGNSITHEVVSNIDEIKIGLNEISKSVKNVAENSHQVDDLGNTLDQSVKSFKI